MKTYQILHLKRRTGSGEFILPFTKKTLDLESWETGAFEGTYGSEPRPESSTQLRQKLYDVLEESLLFWHSERQFIPRFLGASALFFVMYFFLTLVVRLPIHFIIKLIISLGFAVGAYFFFNRWDSKAQAVADKRDHLRDKIDRTSFIHDPRLLDLEAKLDTLDSMSMLSLSRILVNPEGLGDPDWAFAVESFGQPWQDLLQELSIRRRKWSLLTPERASGEVEKWLKKKNADPGLLALALEVDRSRHHKNNQGKNI